MARHAQESFNVAESSCQPVKVIRNASGVPVRKSGPAPFPEEVTERARCRATQLESTMQLLGAEDPRLDSFPRSSQEVQSATVHSRCLWPGNSATMPRQRVRTRTDSIPFVQFQSATGWFFNS